MRKLLSILVALCMVFSLSATVFATSINIGGDSNAKYEGYKLLNLTTSLKTGTHHPKSCDGTNHSDDCYNYAYSMNDKYRSILQKEVFGNTGAIFWGSETKPSEATGITDKNILDYLETLTSDNGDVSGSLRLAADRIYRAIQKAALSADKELIAGNNTGVDQGYWMVVDVTANGGQNAANSLVMLDTKGASSITLTPKTAIPQLVKKVKDIEDSEDNKIDDNPWYDSADFDIGDDVPFKLTGTLPTNAASYEKFTMNFHDTLSEGLTLKEGTIKVLMYETLHKADVDTDLSDAMKDVTGSFTVKTSATDGCSFDVVCDNVFNITGVTKETVFVVYYEATLNAEAVIGKAGNANEAYLEYSNNPYKDTTGKTKNDRVEVYTYKVVVNKTDSHGHALEGAGFTLYKKNLEGEYKVIGNELGGINSTMTTFEWTGLDDGDYKLVETTVPEGYNVMQDIVFSISAAHSEVADDPELLSLDGGLMGAGDIDKGVITKDIENHTGTVLPQTGARGTMMLMLFGALLVCGAAVFMITRKKMSVYED